jgi:hypothetical protein
MAERLLVKVLNSTAEKRTYPVMEMSIAAFTKLENLTLSMTTDIPPVKDLKAPLVKVQSDNFVAVWMHSLSALLSSQ